jgi:hypothetical protein
VGPHEKAGNDREKKAEFQSRPICFGMVSRGSLFGGSEGKRVNPPVFQRTIAATPT